MQGRAHWTGTHERGVQMRDGFHDELTALEQMLQAEGDRTLKALRDASQALLTGDIDLAGRTILGDDDVDDAHLKLEQGVEQLLARQSPVASDLRLVLAILHVNLHLERIADQCVTIAKLTRLAHDLPPDPILLDTFAEVCERTEQMLITAMRAFATRDLAAAESLVEMDELIDRANRRAFDHVLAMGPDEGRREWGMRMIVVSRCLERAGDRCVDIGEQTAYLVTGEFREFTDASHEVSGFLGREVG